jgi:hypothetical protein
MLLALPLEITRELLLSIDDSLTYYYLIQTNTLFLDILTDGDKEHIKKSLSTYVKEVLYNYTDCYYYVLPNGQKHGLYRELYKINGAITKECYYINDKKEGLFREWFTNGKLSKEFTYVNDVKNGVFRGWNYKGVLRGKCNYVKGNIDGMFKLFTPNGQLDAVYCYVNNELESKHRYCFGDTHCYDCFNVKQCDIFK